MAPRRYNDVVTEVSTRLAHGAPLDAAALLGFFGRRAVPGIEQVDGGRYRRSMRLAGGPAVIELRPGGGRFEARMWLARDDDRAEAVARCRAMLDLDADPAAIVAALGDDPVVGGLVRATPGLRLPGHADAHELAIRAVLGQQVSLAAAATLAGRLVAAYGEPLERPLGSVTHVFPSAAALAAADPEALAMPRSRARALLGLAAD